MNVATLPEAPVFPTVPAVIGLPRRALELTDRALKADAEQSPEAAAAYKSWLESAGRKRLQELAAADEPDQYDPGGPASSAPPPRHPPRT